MDTQLFQHCLLERFFFSMLSCLCYVATSNKEDGINLIRNSDRISLDFVISAQGIKFLQDPLRVDCEIGLLSRFVIYLHLSTTPLYFYHRVGRGRHLSDALPSVVGRSSLAPCAGLMERGALTFWLNPNLQEALCTWVSRWDFSMFSASWGQTLLCMCGGPPCASWGVFSTPRR